LKFVGTILATSVIVPAGAIRTITLLYARYALPSEAITPLATDVMVLATVEALFVMLGVPDNRPHFHI